MPITDPTVLDWIDATLAADELKAELTRLRDLLAERDELIAAQVKMIEDMREQLRNEHYAGNGER